MNENPDSRAPRNGGATHDSTTSPWQGLRGWWRWLRRRRNGEMTVRETLDELLEEREEAEAPIDDDERILLSNILALRDRDVYDVMVPRVDIKAVEAATPIDEVLELMTREGHSRLPVYRETLDDAIGMVHIKDLVDKRARAETVSLNDLVRRVLFVAPSMQVLELLLEMRAKRSHMALVVDEFGGIDGLVTIEDLVEEIVGEIEDEHDPAERPYLVLRDDGTLEADARATIESLEQMLGPVVSEEEREDIDTLGGLVFSLAGHVPIRGELISHPSGLEFEVIDADPRRIKSMRVRGAPVVESQGSDPEAAAE